MVWTTYLFNFIYFWSNVVKHYFHNPTSFHRLMAILLNAKINIWAYNLIDTELIKPTFDFKPNRYIAIIMHILFYTCGEHIEERFWICFSWLPWRFIFLGCNAVSLGKQGKAQKSFRMSGSILPVTQQHIPDTVTHLWGPQILHCCHVCNCWHFMHNAYICLLSISIMNFTCLTPTPH